MLLFFLTLVAACFCSLLSSDKDGALTSCVAVPSHPCHPARLEDLHAATINQCNLAPLTVNNATISCGTEFLDSGEGSCSIECPPQYYPRNASISCTKESGWSDPAACLPETCRNANGIFQPSELTNDVYCEDGFMLVGTVSGRSSAADDYFYNADFMNPANPPLPTSADGMLALTKFPVNRELKFQCTSDGGSTWHTFLHSEGFSSWSGGDKGTYGTAQWGIVGEKGVYSRITFWLCGNDNFSNTGVSGVGLCTGAGTGTYSNHKASFSSYINSKISIGCAGTGGVTSDYKFRIWVKA